MPTLSEAERYYSERLWTENWEDANENTRKTALAHAKKDIDNLSSSSKFSTEDYKKAVFEQAIFLLDLGPEDLKRLSLQAQGVKSISLDKSVSENYVINGTAYAPAIMHLKEKYKLQVGDLL
jgi:hypothetical protein